MSVGQTTDVTMRAHLGALVAGVVRDGAGQPVQGANVAMVYLDISRVLFSADGRSEPIVSDADGRFVFEHVAAGRVAFVAVAQDLAPSQIAELAGMAAAGLGSDLLLANEVVDAERLRAEFADVAAIAAQAARLGVTVDAAEAMRKGIKPDALRRSVLDTLAQRAEANVVVSAAPASANPGDSPIVRRAQERAAAARK